MLKLVKPSLEFENQIKEVREQMIISDNFAGCSNLEDYDNISEWLEYLNKLENKETCEKDKVVSTTYIMINTNENKIVGFVNLRHNINHPILSLWGGHIGYSVVPFERRKGYGTEILKQMLEKINTSHKELNLDRVLVTCNEDNIASEKIILNNGGVYDTIVNDGFGNKVKRYWIELGDK